MFAGRGRRSTANAGALGLVLGLVLGVALAAGALVVAPAAARAQEASESAELDDLIRWGRSLKLRLAVFEAGGGDPKLLDSAQLGYSARIRFDPWQKTGRLTLGLGRADAVAVRVDARFVYERGAARSSVRVDLSVASTRMSLTLPDVRLGAGDVYGRTAFEATIPVLEGHF